MDGPGAAHLTPATDHDGLREGDREVDARLRAAGLRATAARRSVLGALAELGGHPTADDVLAAVRTSGRAIARASVFNSLRDLVTAGMVLQVEVPGAARYELAGPGHHHFVCHMCGTIIDVPSAVGDQLSASPDLPGVRVDETTVVFRGLCPACVASERDQRGRRP
ncbi:MAG: Fur family transcriptional regulator [Acidimicrobiales bacterium]|nr:Fur family transcriptional regulator [Acidimicrobiales bacterium]